MSGVAGEWTLILDDHTGSELAELEVAPTMRWQLNGPAQVTFALDHHAAAAYKLMGALANGIPQMRCYCTDRAGVPQPRFRGHWWPQKDEYSDGGSTAACTFRSPLALLEARDRPVTNSHDSLVAFIAYHAIRPTLGSPLEVGLAEGDIDWVGGPTYYRNTTERALIGPVIFDLANTDPGLELLERFSSAEGGELGYLDIKNRIGEDKATTVRFEAGEGTINNVVGVGREVLLPINSARVAGSDAIYLAAVTDAASRAKYGKYDTIAALSDVSRVDEFSVLSAYANSLLRPTLLGSVAIDPDPAQAPRPWDDWWLGDTVGYLISSGAFRDEGTARATACEITLDDSGNEESWKVEWGEQLASWPAGVIGDLRRRLGALER